ncbi:MAG TPA: bifunctional 4-hydroxy-2-oxoglutarate aldolase/2-dehydro-3-deoxy-phosphogluconate aldolase [Anaerolineae bacterium]
MSIETMSPIETRLRAMLAQKYVGVVRVNTSERALKGARALILAGFRMVEITLTIPGALDIIKELAAEVSQGAMVGAGATIGAGVMIGAGTVMNAPDARRCIENGAQFIVSPICEIDIIRPCRDAGVVVIPAGMTPTEIVHAWRMGAHVVKVYPAGSVGGPEYIRAIRGPLPEIPLWVSGMVSARQASEYVKAGVQLVGLGMELLPPVMMEVNDWEAITQHAQRLLFQARGEVAV